MIQIGTNIIASGDPLQKKDIEEIFRMIKSPRIEIQNQIKQLRIIRNLDEKQYRILKKRLPYLVCAIFNPNIRRIENFAYTSFFILDIDHISEKGFNLAEIRKKIETDNQVLLSFISPGEDGLKILFQLQERCYDAAIFSIFYKKFLFDFSQRYGLEQVIDTRTSDVTHACFVSYDPGIYYNSQAEPVNLKAFVNTENSHEMFRDKKQVEELEKKQKEALKNNPKPEENIDSEIILQIKTILGNTPKSTKPPVYVPEQLENIIESLQTYIMQTGIIIKEIKNIQYGKKIKANIGSKEAEINLFYGKRGFSVVQSPRTGTSSEMNQLLADLIRSFLSIHL